MDRPSYSHTSRPPTFSSKNKPPPLFNNNNNNNNNGAFFTTSYDDVFGGPPKFTSSASSSTLAPRAEDYSEIFGAFRSSSTSSRSSSSIPVLDLPAVPDDVHSAAAFFDYSEVFGGFTAVDFAVPFAELFRPCDGSFCDADGDGSSDEAWTPVGTESLSDDSDPFAFSEKNQCFSSENSHQPSESNHVNVSYHKVNPGTSTYMPNVTYVAELNDVSGYTCVFDEASSLKEIGKEVCSAAVDDIVLRVHSPSDLPQNHTRETMSHASCDNSGLKSCDDDWKSGEPCVASKSHIEATFASVSDINLGTEPSHLSPPSRPSPVLADVNGDFNESSSSPLASEKCDLETTVNESLPPFFDMKVDASSPAAASAAAMKDAMEKAQVKLKAAKESRSRKDRVQNSAKLHLETDVNGEGNVQGAHNQILDRETRVHATSDRSPSKMKNSSKTRHAKNASQNLSDNLVNEWPTGVSGKPAETKQGKKSSLSMNTDVAGEWKEARQYFEFVNSDNSRLAPQPPSSNGDAKTGTKQQDNGDHDSDLAGEACVSGENRRRLKAIKVVSRQEYYEKMVKVAQEVHDSVICGQVEPDKRMKRRSHGNPRQPTPELVYDPEHSEIPLCKDHKVEEDPGEAIQKEAEKRSKNVLEKEECRKEFTPCHNEQVERNAKCPCESTVEEFFDVKEEEVRGFCEGDKGDTRVQDPVAERGREQKDEESGERQRTESRLAEASKQNRNEYREVADKRLNEAFESVLIEDRIERSHDLDGKYYTKDSQQTKAADKGLKEAFEDVTSSESLQSTCKTQEYKARNLQQRGEYKNYLEQAGDGQGSKKTLEKGVELEKCQNNKETPKQEERRQRLHETRNLIVEHKNSVEGLKQDENMEKLEKTTELEYVEHKSLQTGELGKTGTINECTVDSKVQKGECRSHVKIEWEDEDQGAHSSPDIKMTAEDKHLKSYSGTYLYHMDAEWDMSCKLKESFPKADHYEEVAAQKRNGDIGTTSSVDKCKLEAVKEADMLIDGGLVEPTTSQVDPNDCELERRILQASETLSLNDNNTRSVNVCTRNEQTLKEEKKKVAQSASNPNLVEGLNVEGGENRNLVGEGLVRFNHEKVRSTPAADLTGFSEHASKEELEVVRAVLPEKKDSFRNISHLPNVGPSIERKGKLINHNCSSEEKDEEKDRDRDPEEDHLRKLEEERERLREREKDRMAVEIAVREARDRAYADARDRAERAALERATDEARQRAMTEARERLEKACAEARERSSADKASSEARLRAERAAVERATAEARQRAIEKAMADRATIGARERMQRSVSEKYTSERDVIMRQSSFPTSSERFDTASSEPVERCKARLERHRRTVERVAKALADKNMRDLVAQREQAERTRFAETLDADIKRWSGGKEGNLRALLSTLQYILGPDSGWQPIPLTEVITAAAVKKAYRKATLCVHPDKLQQRGASIQQKYICEKVFDLLKEAWNRFNSEEK